MRSKQKYLFNRGGKYYFIMKIPVDLKDKFHTTWLKRSLKCSDITNAKIAADGLLGKLSLSFALMRSGMITEEQTDTIIQNIFPPRNSPVSIRPKSFNDLSMLYLIEHSASWTSKTSGEFRKILQNIQNIFGDKNITAYERFDCIAVRDELIARKLKPKTINKYLSLLSSLFRWAVCKPE